MNLFTNNGPSVARAALQTALSLIHLLGHPLHRLTVEIASSVQKLELHWGGSVIHGATPSSFDYLLSARCGPRFSTYTARRAGARPDVNDYTSLLSS